MIIGLAISGSHKIRAIFIKSLPKNILHTIWSVLFSELGAKGLHILDSIKPMARWQYIEKMKSGELSHNFVVNSPCFLFCFFFFLMLEIEILIKLGASLMLMFSIWFKSIKNCCSKRRGTPLWIYND